MKPQKRILIELALSLLSSLRLALFLWTTIVTTVVLDRYSGARTVWWVQEEPANMGAWTFVRDRIDIGLRDGPLRRISREASPSPATGSATVHERQQHDLIAAALATA